MEHLRSNKKRAALAILLIWFAMTTDILSFISGYFQYNLLTSVSNGGTVSLEGAQANDSREQLMGILSFAIFIISGITFIQWFRRAYYNLHLRVDHLEHSEGWAAGSWFVPFVCLYRPYHIMRELYIETEDYLDRKKITISFPFSTNMLGVWWTLWIVTNAIGQFVFRYSLHAKTVDELITSTTASMVSNVIGIPLAIITVKVIKDYSKAEVLLNDIKEEQIIMEAKTPVDEPIDLKE